MSDLNRVTLIGRLTRDRLARVVGHLLVMIEKAFHGRLRVDASALARREHRANRTKGLILLCATVAR